VEKATDKKLDGSAWDPPITTEEIQREREKEVEQRRQQIQQEREQQRQQFLQERQNNIESNVLGNVAGDKFSETVPDQTYLVGFEVTKRVAIQGNSPVLASMQPLYRTKDVEKQGRGKLYGKLGDNVERAFAPKGYAVGGLRGQSHVDIWGFELVYMKIKPNGTLDPNDTQTSDWVGERLDHILNFSVLNGKGKHVSSISGTIFFDYLRTIQLEFE
jgi:hypothetical protein